MIPGSTLSAKFNLPDEDGLCQSVNYYAYTTSFFFSNSRRPKSEETWCQLILHGRDRLFNVLLSRTFSRPLDNETDDSLPE